jgi:hypothetical protein
MEFAATPLAMKVSRLPVDSSSLSPPEPNHVPELKQGGFGDGEFV